jgi:hypothetical protein
MKWLVSFFMLCNTGVVAQTWDSAYQTTYYEQKVSLHRLLPDTKNETA